MLERRKQNMKIVRTFHPIGQGAFYSERFFEGSECLHNVVFDCGTLNVENNHKKVVRQAFTKDDTIDYLFISHLDEDHISLVTTLRESARFIRRVVLPYISPKDVAIHKMFSQSLGMTEVFGFWSMVDEAIEKGTSNDTSFLFVYPDDFEADWIGNMHSRSLYSGEQLSINHDWVLIPYNKHIERKDDLERNLNELINDADFRKALMQIGVDINSVDDLKDKITSACFADLISSRVIKKYLRNVYHDLSGAINQNSLLVYSGPITNEHEFMMRGDPFYRYGFKPQFNIYRTNKVACIYTGDGDLDMEEYEIDLQLLWENVGTIQIPHHGSYASFKYKKNKNSFDEPRVFPVSCGEVNKFGHPSSKVLAFLLAKGSMPVVVTEKASTMFFEVITN